MKTSLAFAAVLAGGMMGAAAPASALTMQECSAKYNAAKTGNTLGSLSWNDFRKAQCGDDAAPAAATPAPGAGRAAPAPSSRATSAGAVMPNVVDKKYANEKPYRQRQKTCVDQYNANKANGGNGDLKWIQKGGGYWSQCNTRLKQIQGV